MENRAAGNFRYPKELDSLVLELQRISRLERQYFTDDRRVALSYARKTNGILVEICVPLSDLLKFFRLEFQNFSSRKKKFEIVYAVEAQVLARRRTSWGLKTKRLR